MSIACGHAVVCFNRGTFRNLFGFVAKIVTHIFPGITRLSLQTETCGGFITAMDHAIFATNILGDSIHDAIVLPLHFFQKFGVTLVMTIGHQVARPFPSANVPGRNSPCRTGQIPFSSKEFKINRGSKEVKLAAPFLKFAEFLDGHFPGQEEVLRLNTEPFNHVLFSGIIFIAG